MDQGKLDVCVNELLIDDIAKNVLYAALRTMHSIEIDKE
jgi:hypothetical protein